MSIRQLLTKAPTIACYALILALWVLSYGVWILGPGLGLTEVLNPPHVSIESQTRFGVIFAILGALLTFGVVRKDLELVVVGSAFASIAFAILFGSLVLLSPALAVVPTYGIAMILSIAVCRDYIFRLVTAERHK